MTLVYIPYSGEWRCAAHTAHTVRLPNVLLCWAFVCNSRIIFSVFCRAGKKSAKRDIKCCNSRNFRENAKKKEVNNDPYLEYEQQMHVANEDGGDRVLARRREPVDSATQMMAADEFYDGKPWSISPSRA